MFHSWDKEIADHKAELREEKHKYNTSQWTRNDSIITSGVKFEQGETNEQCENTIF
jgi:hypothetical protein